MKNDFIERRIVIGLIVSTEYTQRIRPQWSTKRLQAKVAIDLANWCITFYDEFNKAPGQEIESIFKHHEKGMKPEEAEDIADLLEGLSDEYERKDKFNVDYLIKETVDYFEERKLTDLSEAVAIHLEHGKITEAQKAVSEYTSEVRITEDILDLSSEERREDVVRAFAEAEKPLLEYPRQLGEFWNTQLTRNAFVAFMAPEKRGKTFWLLEMAFKGVEQGLNVAFFQAGDMSRLQQLRRMSVYLTGTHYDEKYCGEHYEPTRDCKENQLDTCTLKCRESDHGVFVDKDERFLANEITIDDLVQAYKDNPDYKPCYNCKKYWKRHKRLGAVWVKKIDKTKPITADEANKRMDQFFTKRNRRFKLSSHPNKTLTFTEIERILDLWEKLDDFVVDMVVIDYMDIMDTESSTRDFRHQENDKWMRARGLSQKRNVLVLSATQADAKSYEQDTLSLKNFSEDKRKFAHVTSMYGLNQDKTGREKDIGIMRLNEIVVREDSFSSANQVKVLQNLGRGKPFISSFW